MYTKKESKGGMGLFKICFEQIASYSKIDSIPIMSKTGMY